jgi:hypothetical protein
MKKNTLFLIVIVGLFLINISCSDEKKIASAIQDGKELEEGSLVPFLLEQNYPNPFNPTTIIPFKVGITLHVRLRVLTEDWQEVEVLLDKTLASGKYEITFRSGKIPSGEYYYTMEGNSLIQIRKMKVVK